MSLGKLGSRTSSQPIIVLPCFLANGSTRVLKYDCRAAFSLIPRSRMNAWMRGFASPLFSVHFVAADVEIRVREKCRHLTDEGIEKLVDLFARGIHGGIENAPLALDGVRARSTGEFRVTDKPRGGVAWYIELRHHSNAAIPGVGDHVAHFVLCVEVAVGPELMQFGKFPAFDAESLVVGQMPMENVHLQGGDGIDVPLDHFFRHPVPGNIQHETAAGEAGPVLNQHCGRCKAVDRPRPVAEKFPCREAHPKAGAR